MGLEQFIFQVADIRYKKEGFCIALATNGSSVSGKFLGKVGYCYRAEGTWEQHPVYGQQYKVSSAVSVPMVSAEALGRFLLHSLKGTGIGAAFIGSLVDGTKEDGANLEEYLDTVNRAGLIDYVGARNAKKVDTLLELWPKLKPGADLMSPLLGYGLTMPMAEQLCTLFGNRVLEEVENHPYSLITRVAGLGFLTVDRIAMKVGRIGTTDPLRLRAALSAGMRDATNNGDIGVSRKTLTSKTLPLVNDAVVVNGRRKLAPGVPLVVSTGLLAQVLDDMVEGRYLGADGEECEFSQHLVEFADEKGDLCVWHTPLIEAEQTIARRLSEFCARPAPELAVKVAMFASRAGLNLAPEQTAAVAMVLTSPVSVITGGPGTGKSAVLKVILAALDAAGLKGSLAAPTGKAAKRITEATGRKAQTLHSLIGFGPGGEASFNQASPLAAKYLVLDECSMVDTELLAAGLSAAASGCRIILVGDVDQLPSVGPGQVLRDIIRSGVVPVTRLNQVFRQGEGSGIITAAKLINQGRIPETTEDAQFVVVDTDSPAEELLRAFEYLVKEGVSPDEIQVLAPTHKGDAGCLALNREVQTMLNPEISGGTLQRLRRDSGDIRVGDRVIQNKNDRAVGLVNGDIGWVDDIQAGTGSVLLSLTDRAAPLNLDSSSSQHLRLAYAITVHKSQGAEAPYVLLALDKSATFMLRRNLVYTAVTRGSLKVMVFTDANTMAGAVHRGEPAEGSRRTSLVSKLLARFPKPVATACKEVACLEMDDDVPW